MAVLVVYAIAGYLGIGLVLGSVFALRGAARIDANARDAGLLFRILIVPGSAALWPIVLLKWKQSGAGS